MAVDIKGYWAIVTGASSGIGLCFCRELASRGCNLLMISNQERELAACSAEISDLYGVDTAALTLDLTDADATGKIEEFVEARGIEPEILINNAGIFSFRLIEETSPAKVDCFINLHVAAVTRLSRWFVMRRRTSGRGWLLNMSSMSCWAPMPGIALYSATKAYIRVFSRALRYEVKDYGLNVMVACPGGIATDLFGLPENLKRLAVSVGALSTPEKFTRKAVNRMLAGRQQYINGILNRISIVMVGLTPTPVRMLVKHKMLDRQIKR